MNPRTHVLRPQPPVRAFALAAVLAALGAILVVICAASGANAFFMVVSVIVLLLGVLLLVAGFISMRRLRSFVDLTDEGWTVRTPTRTRSGTWTEITRVTSSMDGAHLTLHQGDEGRVHILAPGNIAGEEMNALAADIAGRLDHSRGYRQLQESDLAPAEPADAGVATPAEPVEEPRER